MSGGAANTTMPPGAEPGGASAWPGGVEPLPFERRNYETLKAALPDGFELSDVERRKLQWLASWERETVEVLAGLLRRVSR